MEKVVLCGYMGSGKSRVGVELSLLTGLKHIDLDDFLEEQQGMRIGKIMADKGQMYFRTQESQYFRQLMQSPESLILSLGGGTPAYAGNHELLAAHPKSFYLKTSIETLFARLKNETQHRPLLSGKDDGELKEYIAKHVFERQPYYHYAQHVVPTDGKSPEEIAREILALI